MQPSKVFRIIMLQFFFVSACSGGEDKNIAQPQIIEEPYFDIEATGNCAIRAVNWALGNERFISPKEYYEYMENQSMNDTMFSEEQRELLREHFKDETKKYNFITVKKLEYAFDKAKTPGDYEPEFDPTFNTLVTDRGLFGHNKAVEHVIDVIKFKFGLKFQTTLEEFDQACAKKDFESAKGLIIFTDNHFDGLYKGEDDIWYKEKGGRLSTDHISYIAQRKEELTPDLTANFRILYFTPQDVKKFQNALNKVLAS